MTIHNRILEQRAWRDGAMTWEQHPYAECFTCHKISWLYRPSFQRRVKICWSCIKARALSHGVNLDK